MKRLFTIAIMLVVLSAGAQAQYRYKKKHTYQKAHVPDHVINKTRKIHRTKHLNWVSTRTQYRRHRPVFVVTMQKGPWYVEYTMNRHGDVLSKSRYRKTSYRRNDRFARGGKQVVYEHWRAPQISYNRYGYSWY